MDFPNDITTNVFSAGDIKEVHWAFYAKKPNNEAHLQDRPSGDDKEDVAHLLQSAESNLRGDGYHTVFDTGEPGLWVFSLSQALEQSVARSLGSNGLESISTGIVLSGDLMAASSSSAPAPPSIKTARFIQSTAAAIGEVTTQAYGSNAGSNMQLDQKRVESLEPSQIHSVSRVYSNLISALSCSLSYALGKRKGWIQLGPYTCVDIRTLGDDSFENWELHPRVATTLKLNFDVKWLSCGTMLLSILLSRVPRHSRISTMLSKDGSFEGLALGSPIILSPIGIRGQYQGAEHHPKSDIQRKSIVQAKASVLSRLAYRGIVNIQDLTWIQVGIEKESSTSRGPSLSLWPANLCFCEDTMTSVSEGNLEIVSRSIVDCSVDPLEEAESWFRGKDARREALQARLKEESQRAQVVQDPEDTDDEEALSPFENPMDQGITPQDVSGIYPTPPDGAPQALQGSSNQHIQQSSDYVNEEKDLQPTDEVHGDFEGQENDDLFGDMDIDMFASNGLTEADFSFFDEPGMMDEDIRETGQTVDEANETTDHNVVSDAQVSLMTPSEKRDNKPDQTIAEDPAIDNSDQESVRTSRTTESSISDKDYAKSLKSTVKTEDVDYAALERLNLHYGRTLQDAHGGSKGSFDHVPFQIPQFNLDDKYNMQGRFAFDVDELPVHSKNKDRSSYSGDQLMKLNFYPKSSPMEESVATSDEEEDVSSLGDTESLDPVKSIPGSFAEPSRKRKREQVDGDDHPVSPSHPAPRAESTAYSPHEESHKVFSDPSKLSSLEKPKDVLNPQLQKSRRSPPAFTGQGQTFIEVAQLVAHQAVSGEFESRTEYSKERDMVGEGIDPLLENTVTQLLSEFFPMNKRCSLREYVSLGEKNPANVSKEQVPMTQKTLKPTHTAAGTAMRHSIFKIDSPYARIQRHGVSTEVSVPALSFWEELSLGPSYESKDIDVFCVCPDNKYVQGGAISFLNMIKWTYQSCNLGSHDFGGSLVNNSNRVLKVPIDASKADDLLQSIAATCERLGTKLPELGLQNGTTVIYIINPFNDQKYLPGLFNALSALPNAYHAALEKRRTDGRYDLVMQIVPLDLVWSPERIVVPSPADYRRLAFEVYDKCGLSESDCDHQAYFMSSPAIRLAKAIPRAIDFKLVPDSSGLFIQSDNCVHLSYSYDATNEWLAACWTDNLGVLSWRACYCLGKNDELPWRPFYESVREVLETSFDMLHPPNALWRLFVCKEGPIAKMENDVWLRALADSSRPSTSCAILTVDSRPPLIFSYVDLQKSSSDVNPGALATPEATPHTNAPSPDISALGSTPAANPAQVGTPPASAAFGDHDSEARLVDVTDETWGVVMDGTVDGSHTLSDNNNNNNNNDTPASLASGYLIKRAGPGDPDGLLPLGVTLVHAPGKAHKALLREVLGMYRNLATLARVRGVVHPVKGVLPLHVAVAKRARQALCETMRSRPA